MEKLFLLDAYALIYRAYYAFIKNPRINSKGFNTSAIMGFVNTLEDVLKKRTLLISVLPSILPDRRSATKLSSSIKHSAKKLPKLFASLFLLLKILSVLTVFLFSRYKVTRLMMSSEHLQPKPGNGVLPRI